MSDTNARDVLIALSLLPFLTPNRVRLLLEYFEPLTAVQHASASALARLLSLPPEQAEEVKHPATTDPRVAALREHVVTLIDEAYPPQLRAIVDPPLLLHVRGDVALLSQPSLAMVGSRRATPYGVNAAQHLARALAPSGLAIVSGLARGIDAAAHYAALDAGAKTIAVLGTGIDVVYPRSNARLFRRIESEGLIVSELAPGTPPKPENFPSRNRIISGLALGTVIVEATRRSGSLITARMAAEQGREVFAVPGSIFNAGSEGTHRLVQYGAKLVHDANDILDELRLPHATTHPPDPEPDDAPLREVLAALTHDDGTHIDSVAAHVHRAPGEVAQSLLQLELGGWIRALPGARYVRVK
ncbi:MAG TPA: DNA-processing protein DprA [Thermoanaerobaculia bacterium]|jgi:DNA processing protein